MNGVTVPTRIIMAGTSTMKLNERFSNLPQPKRVATQVVRRTRAESEETYPDEEYDQDLVLDDQEMDDEMDDINEIPVRVPVRQHRVVSRRGRTFNKHRGTRNVPVRSRLIAKHVPIENRLSVVPQPKIIYVPVPMNSRFSRGYQRGFGRGLQQYQQNSYRRQNNSFNRRQGQPQRYGQSNFSQQRFGRGGFRGRGRGRGFNNNRNPNDSQPKKTIEQLDRELDEYMNAKNSKHPRIIV